MTTEAKTTNFLDVDIRKLHPNRWNPNELSTFMRKALKQSMSRGTKATVLIRPCTCELIQGKHFEIIDGEQRWSEARDSGMKTLKALVIEEDDVEAKLDTLALNKIKGDVNPVKLVALINDLQTKHNLTIDEITMRSGFTAPEIKIAMNKVKEVPVKEKEKIPVKFSQLIILGTEEELGIINNAIESHKAKYPDKAYQRNGTVLADIYRDEI